MSGRLQLALEAIRRHYCDYGCSPSFRELGEAIGVPVQRVSAIVRDLVASGAIGFVPGVARSITLPAPMAMASTSSLLLELQGRGHLIQLVPAITAEAGLANVFDTPSRPITLPYEIVTEIELPDRE